MASKKIFDTLVEKYIEKNVPEIAIGIDSVDAKIVQSLKSAREFADILLIGDESIKELKNEFRVEVSDNPEEKLAKTLAKDKVDGIVRGTVDDLKTYETYERITGESYSIGPGLLEDAKGRQFFMSPLSNREGWDKKEKYEIAHGVAEFVDRWEINPKVALFTGVRHLTYERKNENDNVSKILNETYRDAEWIVSKLEDEGYTADNWSIDLKLAVEGGSNIIVPVNGMVGNQIFRTLLLCGGNILAMPRLGLSRYYEDNSQNEEDLESHCKWLCARINKGKHEG